MEISQRTEGKAALVSLSGEVDMATSVKVRGCLLDLVEKEVKNIIVNLGDVSYMDSAGLATLVECLQGTRKYGGRLILAKLLPNVKDVFAIARLDTIFEIYDTEEDALKALTAG